MREVHIFDPKRAKDVFKRFDLGDHFLVKGWDGREDTFPKGSWSTTQADIATLALAIAKGEEPKEETIARIRKLGDLQRVTALDAFLAQHRGKDAVLAQQRGKVMEGVLARLKRH